MVTWAFKKTELGLMGRGGERSRGAAWAELCSEEAQSGTAETGLGAPCAESGGLRGGGAEWERKEVAQTHPLTRNPLP